MKQTLLMALLLGSVVCGATNFPSHIGMGSKASTVGKISSYTPTSGGLWTGYWRPNNLRTTSVSEEITPLTLKAWPMPANDVVNIEYTGKVAVYAMTGEKVFYGTINNTLDVSNYTSGVYVVKTEQGNTIKIIKQ